MPAHHATIKNAAKFGIILTGDADSATAKHAQTGVTIEGIDGKVVTAICRIAARLKAEYPMLVVEFDEGDEGDEGSGEGRILPADVDAATEMLSEGEALVTFSLTDPIDVDGIITEALEAAQEADISLDGDDEDEETVGNVVPEKYKIEYAARGNRDHCGDWLAKQLDGKFREIDPQTSDDMFSVSQFLDFLRDNGTDLTGKWVDLPNSGQHGAIGRFRMNGRQKLEKALARKTHLIMGDRKIAIPAEVREELASKHPEPKAKVARETPAPKAK